jgi:hypothetical protein
MLFKAENFIRCNTLKMELGHKTIRGKANTPEEAQEWIKKDKKNSIEVANGNLWSKDSDLKFNEFNSHNLQSH